jgi:hypothetical protein
MEGTREKKHRISNPDKRHRDFADSASNPEPEDEEDWRSESREKEREAWKKSYGGVVESAAAAGLPYQSRGAQLPGGASFQFAVRRDCG